MVPAKAITVRNGTPLPESIVQDAANTLSDVIESVISFAKLYQTKALVAAPDKKHNSQCKNDCVVINWHGLILQTYLAHAAFEVIGTRILRMARMHTD